MKRLLLAALLFLAPASAAFAGDTTYALPVPCTGVGCVNQTMTTDGSGSVIPKAVIVDPTTPTQKLGINSSGQAAIQAPPSLPLPSGAATSVNQEVTAAGSSASSAQGVQGVTGGVPLPVSQGTAAAITAGWPVTDGAGTDATGTITGTGASTVNASIDGFSSAKIQIKGTYAGFTVNTLVSSDGGTTFVPLQCALTSGGAAATSFILTANQSIEIACGHQSGDDTLQLQTSTGPATGTANVDISPSAFPSDDGQTVAIGAIAAGSTIIGKVGIDQTTPGTTNGVQVNVSALPTGGSTSALQTTGNTSLSTIATNTTNAATTTLQTTGNTSLSTIATNTTGASTATNQTSSNTVQGGITDGPCATPITTGSCSQEAVERAIANAASLIASGVYPNGATAITASATGTTGATTATLAASASLHTYICGFSIRANATAAATADSTVTGVITGTMHYTQWTAPAASGIGLTEQIFSPCIPSSAINTGIAVISAAPGSGGVVSVTAWGFQGPT